MLFFGSIAVTLAGIMLEGIAGTISQSAGLIFFISAVSTIISNFLLIAATSIELTFEKDRPTRNIVACAGVYLIYTSLLVMQFSVAWGFAGGFGSSEQGNDGYRPFQAGLTEAVYFATTVLTTVGFGDYTAKTEPAKWYFCFEALIAVTHNVVFFSALMLRLTSIASSDSKRNRMSNNHKQRETA